jgi:hypothetical protein
MPNTYHVAPGLVLQLCSSTACELLPELASYGLQGLIELETSAVLGAVRLSAPRCDSTAATSTAPAIRRLRWATADPQTPPKGLPALHPRATPPGGQGALYAIIMDEYFSGASARKVDALVAALGPHSGISK